MRKLSKALRVDLLRSVFSGFFLLSIGLMLAWLMLCGWTYYTSDYAIRYGSVQLLLNDTLIEGSGFLYLLPAVAASGYGWSYCTDYNSKFSLEAQSRVGMWAYSVSKVISVALAAFLASALAMGIYVLFLCTLGMKPPVREDAWGGRRLYGAGRQGSGSAVLPGPVPDYRLDLQLLGCHGPDRLGLHSQPLCDSVRAGHFALWRRRAGRHTISALYVFHQLGDCVAAL